jgi:hypothetical protein
VDAPHRRGDGLQVRVAGGKPQVQPPAVPDQPGGDVEDGQPQPLAAGAAQRPGQRESAQPEGHVGRRGAGAPACQYSQLPKNGCTGTWIIPKSFFSAQMVPSPDTAAQPVVRLDGRDRMIT